MSHSPIRSSALGVDGGLHAASLIERPFWCENGLVVSSGRILNSWRSAPPLFCPLTGEFRMKAGLPGRK